MVREEVGKQVVRLGHNDLLSQSRRLLDHYYGASPSGDRQR